MKKSSLSLVVASVLLVSLRGLAEGPTVSAKAPADILEAALSKITAIVEPATGAAPQTFSATLKVVKAAGISDALVGHTAHLAFQAPDRFKIEAEVGGDPLEVGRAAQELWINSPSKKFGLIGSADVPRFTTAPDKKDGTQLPAVRLPLPKDQILLIARLLQVEALPPETVDGAACHVLRLTAQPQTRDMLSLPNGEIKLWVRESDSLPTRLRVSNEKGFDLAVDLMEVHLGDPWPEERWKLSPGRDGKTEVVALSHLTKFIPAALSLLDQKIPTLGPAKGERKVVATEGKGRLEEQDATKVLFLKGTPEEMGHQYGVLMRKQIKDLLTRLVYRMGVSSSFEKGRWFFGELEEAQKRLMPYMDERYLREMDAMAVATGCDKEEIRLANFFPELFHCSGFSIFGSATVDGHMYHGRILDYMKGVGLEPNAVVIIHQPDYGNAWVNISYAGFVGSVTAMNEKHISIGEMGGRGQGQWDGKPMAQLLREVMEKAETLDQAVEIMRKGPRTCEYYYVVSDGNSKNAVGIAATPTRFDVIHPGESHPQLPHPVKDAVLMSAGDRYEKLAERVTAQHGKLDAEGARHLMDRPVCMTSNIHSVLFEPDTLDFWVANADSKNVASNTRYTHYNLAELLRREPEKKLADASK